MKSDGIKVSNFALLAWVVLTGAILLLTAHFQGVLPPSGLPASQAPAAENEGHGKRARPANSEDRWHDVAQFMSEHSKRKWKAFQELPETAPSGKPSKATLKPQLIAQLDELERTTNEKLRDDEINRVQIEDEIFGALADMKQAHTPINQPSPAYMAAVRSLVENQMEERQHRLENLQSVVVKLKDQVTKDEALKKNPNAFNETVRLRAISIASKGRIPPAQGGQRRRSPGQLTTSGSEGDAPAILPENGN